MGGLLRGMWLEGEGQDRKVGHAGATEDPQPLPEVRDSPRVAGLEGLWMLPSQISEVCHKCTWRHCVCVCVCAWVIMCDICICE